MKKQSGQILPMLLLILVVIMIMVPALIFWVQNDTKATTQEQKSTIAFNLAEAGVDRGSWRLRSSTSTWTNAKNGIALAGYDFDVIYDDITGGIYRIRFSPGPAAGQVTIWAEGKDNLQKEVRSIKAVYQNITIPGAVISGGTIQWANAFEAHWGPVMAHNNIDITDANAAQDYYPRKFSKQVVTCVSKGYQRDVNGLTPPNTDGLEWWSDYAVPELPVLDFVALRSSATLSGTLNIYGCKKTGAAWDARKSCPTGTHTKHFGNPYNHPDARKNYVWYWDNDVEWIGNTGSEGSGVFGTVIARGNLTLNVGDNYSYTGHVPPEAWREYAKITKTTGDTKTTGQYPADDGLQKNNSTFKFGSETWTGGPVAGNTDVGIRGFIYVGGNLDIQGPLDVNGAFWVSGNINKAVGVSERIMVFFDDTLNVPSLNVVLVRLSWDEVLPSSTPWP